MLLGAHDVAGFVVSRCRARSASTVGRPGGGTQRRDDLRGLGERHRRLVAVVDLAPVLATPQPVLEFADGRFECGIETVGAGLASDDGPAASRGDLDVLAVLPLATVAFVVEFDVEQVDGPIEALQARQLLCDVEAEVVGNLDVAALDDDLGAAARLRVRRRPATWSCVWCPRNWVDILGNSFLLASHATKTCMAWRETHQRDPDIGPPIGARCRLLTSYRCRAMWRWFRQRRRECVHGWLARR